MILRLSQKLATKIKSGKLEPLPAHENPYADWSCHPFTAGRTQYIILANTPWLYSCLMPGRGISDDRRFIAQTFETIQEFMADDGKQFIFKKFIAPSSGTVSFAKALNRSVTGSMNDHICGAKLMLEDGMSPSDIGCRLNETPMSTLGGADGRKYGKPRDAFVNLIDRMGNECS